MVTSSLVTVMLSTTGAGTTVTVTALLSLTIADKVENGVEMEMDDVKINVRIEKQ